MRQGAGRQVRAAAAVWRLIIQGRPLPAGRGSAAAPLAAPPARHCAGRWGPGRRARQAGAYAAPVSCASFFSRFLTWEGKKWVQMAAQGGYTAGLPRRHRGKVTRDAPHSAPPTALTSACTHGTHTLSRLAGVTMSATSHTRQAHTRACHPAATCLGPTERTKALKL